MDTESRIEALESELHETEEMCGIEDFISLKKNSLFNSLKFGIISLFDKEFINS